MKIRDSFVSNSSSTSFTFIFKGDKIEDLFDLIRKYNQYFDLYFTSYDEKELHCTAEDVIRSIEAIKSDLGLTSIYSFHQDIKTRMRDLEKMPKESKDRIVKWYDTKNQNYIAEESIVEEATKKEFKSVLIIDFGDNHGNISGGNVGYCMDYEGRDISINKPDLIVMTEQNR